MQMTIVRPVGTIECSGIGVFNRPYGTAGLKGHRGPSNELLGYFRASLRDERVACQRDIKFGVRTSREKPGNPSAWAANGAIMLAVRCAAGGRSLRKGFAMKCSQCSGEVQADSLFCPHCGAQLAGAAAPSSEGRTAAAARFRPVGAGSGNQPMEKDLWSGTYSPKAMIGPAIGLGILTVIGLVAAVLAAGIGLIVWGIGAVVLWLLLAIVVWYRRLTVQYRLTSFRFFHETGLLSRVRNRIEVIDINDVTLQQGLIERMFNVGTIHIQSSDVTDPDIYLPGIEDVRHVTDLIDNTRRAERQRRGVFMENIGSQPSGLHGGS